MKEKSLISALLLALGIALAGFCIYEGIHQIAVKDRTVTVKGLSTRDVRADYVVWPIRFAISGNDLRDLYEQSNILEKRVRKFFTDKGFNAEEISIGIANITDHNNEYYSERRPAYRYTMENTLIISTKDVERVIANRGCLSELMSEGVILNSYQWDMDYQYNGLSDLKPEMIEEATKNARAVAQKFADDSQSSLGSIRHAYQGQFTIEDDSNQPWIKHIRVVTTVDYNLK